ncbi:MAG: nucleotide sugar dehydrogenase [Sphingobacteriales bacterium]|nr:MAG: nucleotide sugar dehydrogenase [Sphingobacteriales bacterium]
MYDQLVKKEKTLALIGLGYVGLPIALAFAKKFKVIGFDIKPERVALMNQHIDPSNELTAADFEETDITFTSSLDDLRQANFFIVAVPTPIDEHNNPDLGALYASSTTVGKVLKQGDYVVYESTVYPGCTEEDCVPILEKESGLKFCKDFKVGYSPERINPGDKEHTITKITKVVSGCDAESLDVIAQVYSSIIEAGVHKAATIKVAEAAKVIENTQRDLNIALMNELSIIFNKMNINTYDVLEAAGTKWNFLKFSPGLVGGHCIGVDPYYLTYKSAEIGYHSKVILAGRQTNDSMGAYVAKETVKLLISKDKSLQKCRVLVLGATFKENVSDIRNSKVADVIKELQTFFINVEVVDPHASSEEFEHEYNIKISEKPTGNYDAVILAVSHKEYMNMDENELKDLMGDSGIVIDIKGIFKNKIKQLTYWSL